MLTERQAAILSMVVDEYVQTAEPVSSKALVDRRRLEVSTATIRNELARLEAEGFVTHPYTSAGRVPSDRGYRFYVEALMAEPGIWQAGGPDCLHPGRRAQLLVDGQVAGFIGALHPELARELDVDSEVLVAELSLDAVRARLMPRARELSRFPSVRRDLALVLPEAVAYDSLRQTVTRAAGSLLRELRLFDVYRGTGIEKGCKSFAIGLIFQDDSRTLGDADVDRLVAAIIEQSAAELGAQVRS